MLFAVFIFIPDIICLCLFFFLARLVSPTIMSILQKRIFDSSFCLQVITFSAFLWIHVIFFLIYIWIFCSLWHYFPAILLLLSIPGYIGYSSLRTTFTTSPNSLFTVFSLLFWSKYFNISIEIIKFINIFRLFLFLFVTSNIIALG